MPTVSTRWDIKSLIEHYAGVRVVSEATVRGVKEYHANCPWCPGTTDSFIMRPETGQFSHAIRSGCGRVGDGVDFLTQYMGMSYAEAQDELGLERVSFAESQSERTQGIDSPPPKLWQDTGKNFVERAARYLWSNAPDAQQALTRIRKRGLSDGTIKKKKYGYCPLCKDGRWYGSDPKEGAFERWGLKPEDIKDEKKRARGTILIPPGIVMPWFECDTLWKIEIWRYDEPDPKKRYGQVLGSAEGLYNVDTIQYGKPCMLVEAKICADSVEQEAGDLVAVVATGSAARGRSPRWTAELSLASFIVQAFDDDEAGEKGAEHWLNTYEKCFRFQPMYGKDPNEMLQNLSREEFRNWVLWTLYTWENSQRLDNLSETTPARVEEETMAPHWQALMTKVEHRAEVLDEPSEEYEQAYEDMLIKPKYDGLGVELSESETQAEFERLCISDRVQTQYGLGTIWDPKQLCEQIQRGMVRVTLDIGKTELFGSCQLEPVLEAAQLSLVF